MGSDNKNQSHSRRTDIALWSLVLVGIGGVASGLFFLLGGGINTDPEQTLNVDPTESASFPEKETKDEDQSVVVEASPIVDELLELIIELENVNIDYRNDLIEQAEIFRTYINSVVVPQGEDPVDEEFRSAWQEVVESSNFDDLERAASELASDLRDGSVNLSDEQDGRFESDDLAAGEILQLHREHAKAWERFADQYVIELGRWQQSWEQNSPSAREFDLHLLTAMHEKEVDISATFTTFCRALRSIDETVPLTPAQLARVNGICDVR